MSGNEPITLATVREYILRNGNKVRNHDLITHFRQQLNDPVTKGKVRADFKEFVHQLTIVQTIDGEKYFVLKRPKEAPAVLRKPPPRPHHGSYKPRPVSAMPVVRHTKMFEDLASRHHQMQRSRSEDQSMNDLPDKENRPREGRGGGEKIFRAGSVESIDSAGSGQSTPKMARKWQPGKGDSLNRNSQAPDDVFDDQDLEGDDLMNIPTIHLDALEKEWMLTTARGNRAHIMCLLEQEPSLANKKDFTTGYTALHWAAKHGRDDVVAMVLKAGVDVNTRTHGGYTALHLASMHGHDKVIKILVDDFEANINARDNSGRKPRQVARADSLTIEAQRRLESVLPVSDSSSESGYGSYGRGHNPPKQYGSLNSIVTPSATLLGYNAGPGGVTPVQPDTPSDKHRDRASSFGKFLHKKKHKAKDRPPIPTTPHGATTYGPTSSAGLLIGSPLELQKMEEEKRDNELDIKRTHSDPNLLSSEI